ncbi:hypothetical protein [Bacillus cereus]|uniref:hypothetical protein n=1 Tax=Bacillus cereus TaxID=1396 RepID=UPI000B4AC23C|nr:hypothetical protein [Bacillus cereus]
MLSKIGFSGKMTAGKTTISNKLEKKYGYVRLAIGDRIKKVSNLLIEDKDELSKYLKSVLLTPSTNNVFDFNEYQKYNTVFKNLIRLFEDNFKSTLFIKESNDIYVKNADYRELVQLVGGTVRQVYGEAVWCAILLNEADELINQGKRIVCDDLRLEIEYMLFQNRGYTLIRLDVKEEIQKQRIIKLYGDFNEESLYHKTEVELDNKDFIHRMDTTIESIDETFSRVEKILKS